MNLGLIHWDSVPPYYTLGQCASLLYIGTVCLLIIHWDSVYMHIHAKGIYIYVSTCAGHTCINVYTNSLIYMY